MQKKSTNEICNNTNSNNLYTILASNATLDTNIDFSKYHLILMVKEYI